jgi:hypothetical protein
VVHASIVNKAFTSFLAAQSGSGQDGAKPVDPDLFTITIEEFMQRGLNKLADLKDDPSITERDPRSPLSFSCTTPEIVKHQEEMMRKFIDGQQKAFSPLGTDGRPIRK